MGLGVVWWSVGRTHAVSEPTGGVCGESPPSLKTGQTVAPPEWGWTLGLLFASSLMLSVAAVAVGGGHIGVSRCPWGCAEEPGTGQLPVGLSQP